MDDFAKNMFESLGFNEPTPELIETYLQFKKHKDKIQPGRLSAEGYATVAMLAELRAIKKTGKTVKADFKSVSAVKTDSIDDTLAALEADELEKSKKKVWDK